MCIVPDSKKWPSEADGRGGSRPSRRWRIVPCLGHGRWPGPPSSAAPSTASRGPMTTYATSFDGQRFAFPGLKTLLAKASPNRSGDHLAGIAAASDEERVAACIALADVPLKDFLNEAVVPYEDD